MDIGYSVVRSFRKSIAITVRDGKVIVKAPLFVSGKDIQNAVYKHRRWILTKLEAGNEKRGCSSELSKDEVAALKASALEYFTNTTDKYSDLMGLKYSRIRITAAQHRYGSCSSKGNICFSYRLMLYPESAREYVVVHELAHLVEMNHSPRFYAIVEKYMPDYKQRKKLLD